MTKARMIAAAGTALFLTMVSSPVNAQDVRRDSNGNFSVHYPGPCTLYYDRYGRRISDSRACNGTQRRLADNAVRARIGGYGSGDYGYGQNYGYRDPVVRVRDGGWGTVDLRNGCVVTFSREGRQVADTRPCNGIMRDHARRLWTQRTQSGGYYPQGGYGQARLIVQGNTLRVDMVGYNCTYIYTTGGNHIQSLGGQCTSRLRDIANAEVRAWREGGRYR